MAEEEAPGGTTRVADLDALLNAVKLSDDPCWPDREPAGGLLLTD